MNEQLPIFLIPTEILSIVFEILEEEHFYHDYEYTGEALLTDARLFGHPLSSNPRWLAIMLEKSGNLPLDVKYNAPVVLRGAKALGSLNKLF